MKRLILNADDYGYTAGVSAGIRRAYHEGIVTSTSVMMTMPHARAALRILKDESPALGVGVHLTITEGVPYRLPGFPSWKNLGTALADIPVAALRDEWRAQIDDFLATGLPLTHLDSHHHAAYRHENALAGLLELAQHYRVPVRNPYPLGSVSSGFAVGLIAASGVRCPAHFVDVFDRIVPSADAFSHALGVLEPGVTEFMVHPGMVDEELLRLCPNFAEPRAQELSALTDPRLPAAVRRFEVELVNFGALRGPDGRAPV